MLLPPLKLKPLYQERVWGGRSLETAFTRILPPYASIGESWEIVDRPEAQSVIEGGPLAGATLRNAIERHTTAIMGPLWSARERFPILVKWLDCRERLSLQVHPPATIARELGGEPKTENWYVAKASPNASLIVGLKDGISRQHFLESLRTNTLESCVHRFPVRAGESILVRSGQIHAIDAGNLILEIQQNSDTTYRVHDWGRVGLDGKPREIHLHESLRSITWDEPVPLLHPSANTPAIIADATEFRIRRVSLTTGEQLVFEPEEQPRILSVVQGQLRDPAGATLSDGDNVLVAYNGSCHLRALTQSMVLITENFAGPY